MTRILLFTGKGGVGKTTCAAATALRLAQQGRKTLVLSSDPAHSLADALDEELGPEPREVRPRLFAQEVDLYYSMKKHWGHMRDLMLTVFRWQGVDQVAAEELAALPGMNEGSVLLWLEQFVAEKTYDVIVVDSAPTGETLTLLSLPQATRWWLSKAFPFQRLAVKSVGFGVRKTTGIPLDKGYEELERIFDKLEVVQEVLADPSRTSVRLVTNPEKMVIQEAKRAYTYLQLYGYGVDAVVVNRVLPAEDVGPALAKYVEAQAGYLEEIAHSFEPLPLLRVPHLGEEVFGLELLDRIGDGLYGGRDPAAVYHEAPTYRVDEAGDGYALRLHLPFLEGRTVTARRFGDELVLQVDGQRRTHVLPKFLSYYRLTNTRVDGEWLVVRFEPADELGTGANR